VTEPTTGRVLEALSPNRAMQFYTGQFLDGSLVGKGGGYISFGNAFASEPQHYPNSPNQPDFPSVVLKPGRFIRNTIMYRYSTE